MRQTARSATSRDGVWPALLLYGSRQSRSIAGSSYSSKLGDRELRDVYSDSMSHEACVLVGSMPLRRVSKLDA